MKPIAQAGLILLPILVGGLLGWIHSNYVIGHHTSSSSYFNLTSLDPIAFVVQDIVVSIAFAVASMFLFMIARATATYFLDADRGLLIASAVATVLVLGTSAKTLFEVTAERADHREEVLKQFAAERTQTRQWFQTAAAQFAKLGWVRYPKVRKDNPDIKDGFQIGNAMAMFAPADDAQTVANYYLSKCESWQVTEDQIQAVVRNDGEPFLVRLTKWDGGIGLISVSAGVKIVPLSQPGPGQWTQTPSENVPRRTSYPETDLKPDPLLYPGAKATEEHGNLHLFTPDTMEQVLAFYRSLGARQTDIDDDTAEIHVFEFDGGADRRTINMRHVFMSDGTKGTLILINR